MDIKYNWDDILIVGDSFCDSRDAKDTWPQIVLTNLTGKDFNKSVQPRGQGFPGGAWWAYRKVLLEELSVKVPRVLIVCHTEPFRIPNDKNYSLNFKSVEDRVLHKDGKNHKMPANVARAAELYYKELMCDDFYLWAVKQWFHELDGICAQHGIEKVIHLYSFGGSYSDYTFENGVTISVPMSSYTEEAETIFWRFKWKLANHFTRKGNRVFADTVLDLVNNYPGDGTRLDIKMVDYGNSSSTQ